MSAEGRTAELRPMIEERPSDELQAMRFVAVALGLSSVLLSVTWGISLNPGDTPDTYARTLGIVLAVPALLTFTASWLSKRWVQAIMWVLVAATFVLAAAQLFDVATGASIEGRAVWPLSITAVGTTAAVVAGGVWRALGVLVSLSVLMVGVRLLTAGVDFAWLVNDLQAFFSALVALVLVESFLTATRELDGAVADAMHAEGVRASETGRRAAGQRAQALVHDEVMSTLLLAAQGAEAMRNAVSERAGIVVARIRDLERELIDAPVSRRTLAARVEHLTEQVAPDTEVTISLPAAAGAPFEVAVADAIVGATEQALVNSVHHAGDVPRRLEVHGDLDGVSVVVRDEGRGFDPERVANDRLGIVTSIVGRMNGVGGRARIDSAPGRGTTVQLEWRTAPEPPPSRTSVLHGAPLYSAQFVVFGFCVAQMVMAVIIAVAAGSFAASAVALAGMIAGLGIVNWSDLARPSLRRVVLAMLLTTLSVVAATTLSTDDHGFVAAWALTAAGFVLAALAARGWPLLALGALVVLVGGGVVIAIAQGFERGEMIAATLRLRQLREQTGRARTEQLQALRRTSSAAAARAELRARAAELEKHVCPALEQLHRGEWTERLRRECGALEGRLRDEYRGGRLARSPLSASAANARLRGIDVVLLDDAGDRCLDEPQLDAIAAWMAAHLDGLERGRFTGRLLPADSELVASAVVGDRITTFPKL